MTAGPGNNTEQELGFPKGADIHLQNFKVLKYCEVSAEKKLKDNDVMFIYEAPNCTEWINRPGWVRDLQARDEDLLDRTTETEHGELVHHTKRKESKNVLSGR